MDMYWSVIYSVAGIGAAALVALVLAAAVVLGPWLAIKTVLARRATTGGGSGRSGSSPTGTRAPSAGKPVIAKPAIAKPATGAGAGAGAGKPSTAKARALTGAG